MDSKKRFSKEEIIEIIDAASHSKCLWCWQDIDKSFNHAYRWRVPLCKKCRLDFLEEDSKGILRKRRAQKR